MTFLYPTLLAIGLAVLVGTLVILAYSRIHSHRALDRFLHRENWRILRKSESVGRFRNRQVFFAVGCVFMIIALARPQGTPQEITIHSTDADVVIALDVSLSMVAEDVSLGSIIREVEGNIFGNSTRLRAAQMLAVRTIMELDGNRIALVPFAEEAFIKVPLTTDKNFLIEMVRASNTETVAEQGTNFFRMMEIAAGAFDTQRPANRVLIVITDGEDHSGRIAETIALAEEKGIRVFFIGVGSVAGTMITTENNAVVRDREGAIVTTRLNPRIMEEIATATGGIGVYSASGNLPDIGPLFQLVETLQTEGDEALIVSIRPEYFQIPLLIGLAFLAFDLLLPYRSRKLATS